MLARAASGALALTLTACAPTPAQFATAEVLPSAPRRPSGVALDFTSATPPSEERADSSTGLLALRTPLGVDLALETVDELFRRIVRADSEGVSALFSSDAVFGSPRTPGERRPSLQSWWEQRLRRLDYTSLADVTVYRESDVQTFPAEAPDASVVVRVPIATSHLGLVRLFGDELTIWLRRDGSRYRIHRIEEDFELP